MYVLQSIEVAGLPKLGWLAEVIGNTVTVRHGIWVEGGSGFVVEGVWNGSFSAGDFLATETIFGSGVVATGDAIVFASSAATTDPLHYHANGSSLHVSNSLPLLLASLGAQLRSDYGEYHRINASVVEGIEACRKRIPTTAGYVVRLLHRNLRWTVEGAIEIDKRMPPHFGGYADYKAYLVENLEGIFANARDPARARPLAVFSTQSSGFDSTAVNALCAPLGIDKVFVNRRGKGPGSFADRDASAQVVDDGTPVCEALGLLSIPMDRQTFGRRPEMEDLYLSALSENGEYNLHAMVMNVFSPTMILTGQYGEVWRPAQLDRPGQLSAELRRHDLGGQGWSELRLETGFVHVAVPFLGARRRREISAISGSAEMQPWRTDAAYDKPIPARIATEHGVPRELFGQAKKAAAVEFCPPCIPRDPQLRAEYFEFLASERLLPRWATRLFPLVHRVNAAIWFATPRRNRWAYYTERLLSRLGRRRVKLPLIWERLRGSAYCFAVNGRVRALQRVLEQPSHPSAGEIAR